MGTYLISICTNIACLLDGAYELLEHAGDTLELKPDDTTEDDLFTLEEVECLALCDQAPCIQVNYRFVGNVTPESFDELCADLRAGRRDDEVPVHGVMIRSGPASTSWGPMGADA